MKVRKFLCLILAMTFCFGLSNQAFAYGMGKVGMRNTVSCGYDHTAAIDENGSLWTWGDNWLGKLGTENGFKDSAIPVKVMDNVIAVSCGEGHTAAIKSDNSLWTWGSNSHGQLGNGTNEYSAVPVKVMDNVIAVSCGESHTAAVQTDGTLWTWGSNTEAQLGIGTYGDGASSDVPMKVMDNVAAISCGAAYTAAIQTDGSLWMWGGNDNGELGNGRTSRSKVPVKVLDNAVAVSCGFGHTAAIRNDGSLWMWGYNFHGQLGNGGAGNDTNNDDYTIQTVPVQVMDNVIAVSCLYGFTAAIQTDNSLWIWGDNSHGQFGNGTTTNSTVPIRVMDEVAAISCGYHHTAALKADNSLWTWGWNWDGQLGNGGGGNDSTQFGNGTIQTIPVKVMDNVARATTSVSVPTPTVNIEYIYDAFDPGESVVLNTSRLNTVADSSSATSAVQAQIQSMTTEQKNSATGADLAILYAETAVSKAASTSVSGKEIIINQATVSDLEAVAAQTSAAVETALVNGGVTTARLVSNTVTLTTDETGEITIKIDPDILTTQVDKIRVETPTYAITLKVADLKEDLTEILTITAQDVGSGFAAGNQSKKTTVKVNLPKGKTSNPVTLSLPTDSSDTTYQAVVKTDGSATSSKYNPATTTMDGKVNTSGSYTVQTNQKDFTDIANKSAEMQKAIRYLASKGIINGTSATEFSPDGSINRAEIAALLVRALGKLDNGATNNFTDVKSSDWFYSTAGSSQKCGLIKGYTDNTFRGTTPIIKDQILAVAARVLKNEMGYKEPSNPASYLAKYNDTVTAWAQPEVALATKENLVVYRYDGTFKGESNMTRGDAAIIIYRLFQKIW